ncbi:hypothetical protein CVV68_13395 [Arthrobacter livingstonensis]|uniref:Pvc16 N-terminal domain-containing protein n=1 Tax=Arthrobacter livingstonensis TaxID=670078 RepID=A0A2V5LIA9_9MICC|nr:DUF4255 domain-containing protein [Arthrobacter livingstonensis]PYI66560.1 hypothetical protein CVV68_13395 [Arthrobacter livingstonensis]
MSSTWAIAVVTAALRNLLQTTVPALDPVLSDLSVTTRTPDMARKTVSGSSLNVFLYGTAVNAGWRNQDPPRTRPGEQAVPPLALNLHYLVTAYGRDDADQDAVSHRALAGAMSVLHDHPVFSPAELTAALANSDVAGQPERLRITPLPLTTDELSKLWTAFQTNLRVSAAYEVTVVLIDSHTPPTAPLPVLVRGGQDQGVQLVLGAAASLTALLPPRSQAAAEQGLAVAVTGSNLTAVDTVLRFTSMWRPLPPGTPLPPVEVAPTPGAEPGQLLVVPPDLTADPEAWGRWVPGFYTVDAVTRTAGSPAAVSNAVAFALAPAVTVSPHAPATVSAGGTVALTCSPRIGDGQHVVVLCGGASAEAAVSNPAPGDPDFASTPSTVTFSVPAVPVGLHPVRLRVDGVDSIPVLFTGPVPAFDPAQQVNVT